MLDTSEVLPTADARKIPRDLHEDAVISHGGR